MKPKVIPKKVLIQVPDAETVALIHQHILNVAPQAEVYAPATPQEIEHYYKSVSDIDLLIAEVYIEGIDALTDYINYRHQNPNVSVLIATRYDLSSYADYIQGVPVVVLPYEEKHLESILPQLLIGAMPTELTTSISRKIPIGTQSIKLVQKEQTGPTQKTKPKSVIQKIKGSLNLKMQRMPLTKKEILPSKSVTEVQRELEKKHKKIFHRTIATLLILITLFCYLVYLGKISWVYRYARFLELPWTDFKEMVQIPAGEFVFGGGEDGSILTTATTPTYYIDQYEVTIGQYKQFLKDVEGKNPELFAHVDMPHKDRGFKPKNWDHLLHTIRENMPYDGVYLSMNAPVFNVTWWQAYAYAKWKGKRLPTEQEWEKAARGLKGNKFTWGSDDKATENANLGLDYAPSAPEKGGFLDGYQSVSAVDKKSKDVSEFGVYGMNGNVSEWTGTWGAGKIESIQVPIIRGPSFSSFKDITTTLRILKRDANTPEEWLGFRCASDTPPEEKITTP